VGTLLQKAPKVLSCSCFFRDPRVGGCTISRPIKADQLDDRAVTRAFLERQSRIRFLHRASRTDSQLLIILSIIALT